MMFRTKHTTNITQTQHLENVVCLCEQIKNARLAKSNNEDLRLKVPLHPLAVWLRNAGQHRRDGHCQQRTRRVLPRVPEAEQQRVCLDRERERTIRAKLDTERN